MTPAHVAIIMDGNRRWARSHGLPLIEGYRRGVDALRACVRAAMSLGIERLTVYGFSTENWQRERAEVDLLLQLCAAYARNERKHLAKQGVRVELIGHIDAYAPPVRDALRELEAGTAQNADLTLCLALNYSGRSEIVRAAQGIAREAARGELDPETVGEAVLRAHLYTRSAPDPDLLIRTGGDCRISNFLLYQLAYTELLTLPIMWPDVDEAAFITATRAFGERQRRYGA